MAARISQHIIEVVYSVVDPPVRVTQVVAEVMRRATLPPVRVTQVVAEVMRVRPPGTRFAQVTQITTEIARNQPPTLGTITQVISEIARNFSIQPKVILKSWMVFDKDASIDVVFFSGFPTTAVDDLAVLNGANVVAMGKEIFQFRDVVDLGDSVFRLSYLLRGRLGTEQNMDSHTESERVVLLEKDTLTRIPSEFAELNVSRFWKAVGVGQSIVSAQITSAVDTGTSQKPWAPVHIKGSRDGPGNITISWNRRSRTNFEWRDFVDIGIGELIHEFLVEIISASGSVVRPIEVLSAESVIYTEQQQIDDFGSTQGLISVRVSQKSESFGFGYANVELI